MIYFDEIFLEVSWDADIKAVVMTWKKFVKGEPFRLGLNKGLELVIMKKTSRWLADLRNMQVLDIDDQNWTTTDWYPRAVKGGIRKMAIIMPKSAIAKLSLNRILTKVEGVNIETIYFSEVSEAKKWLNS